MFRVFDGDTRDCGYRFEDLGAETVLGVLGAPEPHFDFVACLQSGEMAFVLPDQGNGGYGVSVAVDYNALGKPLWSPFDRPHHQGLSGFEFAGGLHGLPQRRAVEV